ncbi:MAG: hypothetical protein ACTSVZ_04105 [Promethearchaeota archaeon]
MDHLKKKVERHSFQCPVCGKILSTEQDLEHHLNQLRKYDDPHAEFYEMFEFLSPDDSLPNASSPSMELFQTDHPLEVNDDRFILKGKSPKSSKLKKKFQNLYRLKRNE